MKKTVLFLSLFTLTLIISAQNRAMEIRERLLRGDSSSVMVVAHRGYWRHAPENSIAAVKYSIEIGVDIVEIDLQRTKDSVLIVMHDPTLNRTTTGKGNVKDWTLDSLRTLKLKNGCGIRTKHTIPTLEEVLLCAKGKVMINLDKADRYFDEVIPILEKTGTMKQIIMKGSKPAAEVQRLYGKYLDDVIYMPIVNLEKKNAEQNMADFMANLKPAAYELLYANDSNPLPIIFEKQLRGKALIWYNTLWDTLCGGHDDDMALENPDNAYGFLIDTLGARIIQTDRAEYLIKYLCKRGLKTKDESKNTKNERSQ